VAFTVQQSATTSTVALQTSRRDVLAGIASSGLVVGTALVSSTPAVAAVDDLSMPSEDEQKAAERSCGSPSTEGSASIWTWGRLKLVNFAEAVVAFP